MYGRLRNSLLIKMEYWGLIHVKPETEKTCGSYELIVSIECFPVFSGVVIQIINPDAQIGPTLAHKCAFTITVSHEYSLDILPLLVNSDFNFLAISEHWVRNINLYMWVSNGRYSLFLVFHLLQEPMQTLEVFLMEGKIAICIRVLDIKPEVVKRHIFIVEIS